VWNGGPIARGNLGARPFFLTSTDELRPPPPPAFGSPKFNAALAEVRQIRIRGPPSNSPSRSTGP
jgi:hypothetical protein